MLATPEWLRCNALNRLECVTSTTSLITNNLINKHKKKLVVMCIFISVYVAISWWTHGVDTCVTQSDTSQFLLSIGYWEQLQAAMKSFSHLTLLSADLNRTAVLPHVRDSMLYGVPSCESAVRKLDLYFSLSQLTQLITQHTKGHTATFDTFLHSSPARLQLGLFLYSASDAEEWLRAGEETDQLIQSLKTQSAIECTAFLRDSRVSSLVMDLESWNVSRGFYVHSAICLNPILSLTTQRISGMLHRISGGLPSSLLLNEWRGMLGMSDKSLKRVHLVSSVSSLHLPPWPLSRQVLTAAEGYFRSLNLTRPLIGLHVRMEKLAAQAKASDIPAADFVSKCLGTLWGHLEVLRGRVANHSLLSLCDLGRFGSQSCLQCKDGMNALKLFTENGYEFSAYDPSYGGGETDTGFVSLVELSVLAKSQFLVLVGGGSFQKQLTSRFSQNLGTNASLNQNQNLRLKRICT